MNRAKELSQIAFARRMAAMLIHEAKIKEYESTCWLGVQGKIEEARAAVHSALDATLDATHEQVHALKAQSRGVA